MDVNNENDENPARFPKRQKLLDTHFMGIEAEDGEKTARLQEEFEQ